MREGNCGHPSPSPHTKPPRSVSSSWICQPCEDGRPRREYIEGAETTFEKDNRLDNTEPELKRKAA